MREFSTLLVTGGAGFIGSAFVRYVLAQKDWNGTIVDLDALTYAGNRDNLVDVLDNPRHIFAHGNICDAELVERLCKEHSIDCIVNFAAESHVDRSIHAPLEFIDANVRGTAVLLEMARKFEGLHFHQVSTDEVYGSLAPDDLFLETTAYDPRSPYSASKAAADHFVRAYANTYGISTTISNCSNNYGPYQFPEKLIPLMILRCLSGEDLPVYGDGKNQRDWLYVDDHAEALWTILRQAESGSTYNVGGDCVLRNIELLQQLIDVVAERSERDVQTLRGQITYVKDRPGHDHRYAIDFSKLKNDLGWTPRNNFADGLRRTVDWYLGNSEWVQRVQSGAYRQWLEKQYG